MCVCVCVCACASQKFIEYDPGKNCLLLSSSGGACGVMVIVIGNGHGYMSSNPGRD